MNFIWALILAVAAVSNTDGAASRIVGGESTSTTDYPSIVQVDYRNVFLWWEQTCAGVILTPWHVLSVAHCFTGFLFIIDQRRVRAGATYRNDGGGIVGISRAYNHPSFQDSNEGDITVLLLEYALVMDEAAQPAVLPPQGFEMFDFAPVTITGWGRTWGGGDQANELQQVGVTLLNINICRTRYQELGNNLYPSDTMLCTGVTDNSQKDACEYDQGGPIYLGNSIVLGIVSYFGTCADPTYPRVSTKVSSYSDWIRGTIDSSYLNIVPT